MDNIWYRHPSKSEVFGRCGGDEKTNDHAEPTKKLNFKKKVSIKNFVVCKMYRMSRMSLQLDDKKTLFNSAKGGPFIQILWHFCMCGQMT